MFYYIMRASKHDNSATYQRISEDKARRTCKTWGKRFYNDKPSKRALSPETLPNFYLIIMHSAYVCEECGKEFSINEEFYRLDNDELYCVSCR